MWIHYVHTYIIGHYNPLVRIIALVSHTTYVVCFNFLHKWRDPQFKVDSERQIFLRHISWQILFTHKAFARNLLRGNRQRNLLFVFCFDVWPGSNPGFSSNKPTHFLLDYGDSNV